MFKSNLTLFTYHRDQLTGKLFLFSLRISDMICLFIYCLVTQWCLTLCDPMDCSPPSSSVHGDSPGKNTGVGDHSSIIHKNLCRMYRLSRSIRDHISYSKMVYNVAGGTRLIARTRKAYCKAV